MNKNSGRARDHPRRCGENARRGFCFDIFTGSPPQVRGKPVTFSCGHEATGITPAGAGKTCMSASQPAIVEDHPRRCGENAHARRQRGIITGSPPQVRGKHFLLRTGYKIDRITPAGAGKTGGKDRPGVSNEDHPRRCGENLRATTTPTALTGSPPQVRGKLGMTPANFSFKRITPAGAGKTRPQCIAVGID